MRRTATTLMARSRYEWSFGDGGSAQGKQAEHRYEQEGSFLVKLTVFDDQGASASTRRLFDITLPPEEPVADFQFSCEDRVCELDAGSSTSSDVSITRYDWAFGDGTTGTGSNVTHQYSENGTYTVTLKITASDKTSSRNRTIQVESRLSPNWPLKSLCRKTGRPSRCPGQTSTRKVSMSSATSNGLPP